jgi:hypothetical protein
MADYFEEGIRIDELGPEVLPSLSHIIAAMKDGSTVQLTVEQLLDLFLLYPEFIAKAEDSDVADLQTSLTNLINATRDNLRHRVKVRAATTGNVAIATALNPGDTVDGVALASGDWVLVRAQTDQAQNGIYMVDTVPARVPEYMTYNDHPAAQIVVSEGTVNAGSLWQCISTAGGTLGTTSIIFVAPAAASPTKTAPVSADRFWIWDSVAGLMKGLPLGNLGRAAKIKITTFTASGTWTPDSKMIFAILEAQGAGGGGAGVSGGGTTYWVGGGGGSGAYSRKVVLKADTSATHNVTVGNGGGGGTGTGNGSAGGATSIGTLCGAAGGGGGTSGNSGAQPSGGAGGSKASGTGDFVMAGNPGDSGVYGGTAPTNGGGGGSPVLGSGGRAVMATSSAGSTSPGNNGDQGGGGSGAASWNTTSTATGGSGGNGIAVITEFLSE